MAYLEQVNADIRLISPMDQPPKPYSLQRALQKLSSTSPPLVIEYNGVNHFDAWVRDVTYHKGQRILFGLREAFPKLAAKNPGSGQGKRKVQEKEDAGQEGDRNGARRRSKSAGKRKK